MLLQVIRIMLNNLLMNFLIFNYIPIPQRTERFACASDQNVDQIFYVKFYYLDLARFDYYFGYYVFS